MGGIAACYEAFQGTYPCWECGADAPEAELVGDRFCSYECYGRCVGFAAAATKEED